MRFLIWKWRKYPIRRDEDGRSLRQQAFELFDKGLRPTQIHKQQLVAISQKTLFRYYEDWKKKGGHSSYRIIRWAMKVNPDIKEQIIKTLSKKLKMSVEEVARRLLKPWGLKQALRGQLPDYDLMNRQGDVEARLMGGLRFMRIAELFQNSPKELAELLLQITILKENTILELIKIKGQLIATKKVKGKSKTIKLDY